MEIELAERLAGLETGPLIGDALAMPVHWYYDRAALARDYGRVTDYLAPRRTHPGSILWRSEYHAPNSKGEILHDQAKWWGQEGVHYHQFLLAGESTVNLKLLGLLAEMFPPGVDWNARRWAEAYVEFMTAAPPRRHRDTYVEECHRNFFAAYARGADLMRCGKEEKHIGGLVWLSHFVRRHPDDAKAAEREALEHLALTHPGKRMEDAARLLLRILQRTVAGEGLRRTLEEEISRQRSPLLGHPFRRWLGLPEEQVVGREVSPACYIEDAVPATLFLALKYHDRPEAALVANTNLGGDNCHRGAVLGALLGAENGLGNFPVRWVEGLEKAGLPS